MFENLYNVVSVHEDNETDLSKVDKRNTTQTSVRSQKSRVSVRKVLGRSFV